MGAAGWLGDFLDQSIAQGLLDFGGDALEARRAAPHFGQLVGFGLGPAGFLGGARTLGRQQERSEPAVNLVVVGPRQAGGDSPPEDPPFGPALHILGELHSLMEDRPERLDAKVVERIAAAGAEEKPGHVEPARFVARALEPFLGGGKQRVPQRLAVPTEATRRERRRGFPRAASPAARGRRLQAAVAAMSSRRPADPRTRRGSPRSRRRARTARSRRGPTRLRSRCRAGSSGRPVREAGSGAASDGRLVATGTRARSCRPRSRAPPG